MFYNSVSFYLLWSPVKSQTTYQLISNLSPSPLIHYSQNQPKILLFLTLSQNESFENGPKTFKKPFLRHEQTLIKITLG
jgi:hypothetical protein